MPFLDAPCSSWKMNRSLRLSYTTHCAWPAQAPLLQLIFELISYARICAAIVDVSLGGRGFNKYCCCAWYHASDAPDCSSVCAALTKRSLPYMFYTG